MTDFNNVLSLITDLQVRVSKQESIITSLKEEINRLNGPRQWFPATQWTPMNPNQMNPMNPNQMNPNPMTHPMRPNQDCPRTPNAPINKRTPSAPFKAPNPNPRPKTSVPHSIMSMSDVLVTDETVTIEIKTKNGAATAVCHFDGTELSVTECELVNSIIGLKTSKPGEILFKFRDALHKLDLCSLFECPPWRCCFVNRDGAKKSLESLRKEV